jgi:alcohol dehydrogenase class IV
MIGAFVFRTAGSISFGRGTRSSVAQAAARFGPRALLVTGARSLEAHGEIERLRERFASASVSIEVFVVSGEPDVDAVDRGAAVARQLGAKVVVGVGGGSVLDAAKAVAAVAPNGGSAIDYLEDLPGAGGRALDVAPLPIVAVPSTAGTGSEATRNAVLRVPQAGLKRSMRDDRLLPRVAIVDPDLAERAPVDVARAAGLDALTHLIEAYVSLGAQPTTDLLAFEGARRAASALTVLGRGATRDAWDELSLASLWGGMALANAGLGAVHGLAAPLGGRWAVPHGAACAALLAPTIRANVSALRRRSPGAPALARYGALARSIAGSDDPMRLAEAIDALRRGLGAKPLAALGARAVDVSAVVAGARGGSMKFNPIVLTDAELESIVGTGVADGG